MDAIVGLLVVLVYIAVAAVPLGVGVAHHRRLMGRLVEVGDASKLDMHGKTPPWQTHGKGCTWWGSRSGRKLRVEFRFDPKRRIYAKVQVERRRPLTEGLSLDADQHPVLRQFGFRTLRLEHDQGDLWRLCFVGGDRFSLLADLDRWDPSRDKGAVPKETGNEVEVRLCDGWLELGYRGVTTDRMQRILKAQVELVDALEWEEDRPWAELTARHQLERAGDELRGEVDGRALEVSCVAGQTTIRAPCATALEAAHKDHMPDSRPLANPVLGMLVAAHGPPELDLDALLDDEDLAESLLAVVHAWPGSRVADGAVTLRAPTRIRLELDEAVAHVLRLARRLEERA